MKKKMARLITFMLTVIMCFVSFGFRQSQYMSAADSAEPGNIDERLKDAVVLYMDSGWALVNNIRTPIDEEDVSITPIIRDKRALVPVRFIAEAFDGKVSWDENTKTICIEFPGRKVYFQDGCNLMTIVNSVRAEEITMETPPVKLNGRTFVPISYIARAVEKVSFYNEGLIVISSDNRTLNPAKDKDIIKTLMGNVNEVLPVDTKEKYEQLLKDMTHIDEYTGYATGGGGGGGSAPMLRTEALTADSAAPQSAQAASVAKEAQMNSAGESDFSQTNVQVKGVDEGDIIKTDGKYIYYSNQTAIHIIKSNPSDQMEVLAEIEHDISYYPTEMYLHGDLLITLGFKYNRSTEFPTPELYKVRSSYYMEPKTTVYIYDVSDKKNPKKVREVGVDGNYLTSRKIGDDLYFVTNIYLNALYSREDPNLYATPEYIDTAVGQDTINLDYKNIYYFTDGKNKEAFWSPNNRNMMIIAGIKLDDLDEKAEISSYMGAGEDMYVSAGNMYITIPYYKPYVYDSADKMSGSTTDTIIYKFSLNRGKSGFQHKGTVPGTILNKYSMDESGQNFRIATTSNNWAADGGTTRSNNMYVLDGRLQIVGRIENIAPSETIRSVRFMGNRAYMVTFRLTDPLFTIDLTDPKNPTILGALKIPGYSTYLHPYDETHLIGFGRDTVEEKGNAYDMGIKLSLFDVSDINNPKEMFTEIIGGRGTHSDALYNDKAFLFSKEKGVLALPITLYEQKSGTSNVLDYGMFSFQGAYFYDVDLEKGFSEKGTVTHLTKEDYLKAGNWEADYNKYINRIIYIGNDYFTLSNNIIKANRMSDLQESGYVDLSK